MSNTPSDADVELMRIMRGLPDTYLGRRKARKLVQKFGHAYNVPRVVFPGSVWLAEKGLDILDGKKKR